jgi:predicted alpha-1,6-mannanase (GH76 family)
MGSRISSAKKRQNKTEYNKMFVNFDLLCENIKKNEIESYKNDPRNAPILISASWMSMGERAERGMQTYYS